MSDPIDLPILRNTVALLPGDRDSDSILAHHLQNHDGFVGVFFIRSTKDSPGSMVGYASDNLTSTGILHAISVMKNLYDQRLEEENDDAASVAASQGLVEELAEIFGADNVVLFDETGMLSIRELQERRDKSPPEPDSHDLS